MNNPSRPEQPEDAQGTENGGAPNPGTEGAGAGAPQGAAHREMPPKAAEKPASGPPSTEQYGKARQNYLDPRGSEATREMRDTARRRRDAEEKLQQHLAEAKDHVPNEHHGDGGQGPSR